MSDNSVMIFAQCLLSEILLSVLNQSIAHVRTDMAGFHTSPGDLAGFIEYSERESCVFIEISSLNLYVFPSRDHSKCGFPKNIYDF